MQIATRQGPAYGVARLGLVGGEQVRVEAGAMMAMSTGVVLEAKAEGGVLKSLKRAALGGESFFITTYTAPAAGGWVDVATHLLGDVLSLEVSDGHGLLISRGGWVASSTDISIDAKWGGLKNLMGGEGGFIVRATGTGTLVLACFGALDIWDLADGETFVLDTNHMVAYDESVNYTLRRAVEGRSIQSLKSGEGWVFEFTGPGRVYGQTRSPQSLTKWLESTLTLGSSSPTGGGALGSLLTR